MLVLQKTALLILQEFEVRYAERNLPVWLVRNVVAGSWVDISGKRTIAGHAMVLSAILHRLLPLNAGYF